MTPHKFDQTALGAAVKRNRDERGWSLRDLEIRSGVAKGYLSSIEHGHACPSIWSMWRLADAFDMTLDALAGRDFPAQEQTGEVR